MILYDYALFSYYNYIKTDVPKYGQLKSIFLSTQPQINTSVYSTIKICLFAAPKTQKIRGLGFTSKSSKKPYFKPYLLART